MKHRYAAVAVLTVLGTTACQPAATPPTEDGVSEAAVQASASAPAAGGPAVDVLATLPVKGRAPQTGYDRDQFGPQWADVDRNGCDTRNDVLARDLVDEAFTAGTQDCVVVSGTLADPYTGQTITFQKGDGSSVDIDHVVALSNGWQTGAFAWDEARRTAFANDPLNLLAVDYSANRQKGDGDAATWLPDVRGYRCTYVARQVAVKASYGLWVTQAEHDAIARVLAVDYSANRQKGDGDAATWLPDVRGYRCTYVARQVAVKASYGLWVTQAEHDAIARVLESCPGEPVPASSAPAPDGSAEPSTPAPDGSAEPSTAPADGPAAPFANCAAARAAGVAPLHRGDPGWSDSMDGDGDGTACE